MSVRSSQPHTQVSTARALQQDTASVNEVTWESLSETEKSASTIGVSPDAWKPIGFMNEAHYGELLRNNALGSRLTQQIEAFKVVASQ